MEAKAARLVRQQIYITQSPQETQKIAFALAKKLSAGTILALYGELGSGKTTFVQGLAKGLGIAKRILSPTFIIIRKYEIKIKNQKSKVKNAMQKLKFFYHIDLYRIDSRQDLDGLGLEEILSDPRNIVAIEWAEKMGRLLPKKRWDIRFEYISEGKRKIIIEK